MAEIYLANLTLGANMNYLDADIFLADSVYFEFQPSADPLSRIQSYKVPFQFPPKVTSDSKSGDWDEQASNSYFSEPIPTFKGSKPRTINIKWSYVIDGSQWTTKRVSTIVRALRGYFTRMDRTYLPTMNYKPTEVRIVMYRNIMEASATEGGKFKGRIDSFDITHSENIIIPGSLDSKNYNFVVSEAEDSPIGLHKNAYPLRTDITTTVKLFNNSSFIYPQNDAGGEQRPPNPPSPNDPYIPPNNAPVNDANKKMFRSWF